MNFLVNFYTGLDHILGLLNEFTCSGINVKEPFKNILENEFHRLLVELRNPKHVEVPEESL